MIKDCNKLDNDLTFLPERIKIEKVKKLVESNRMIKLGMLYDNKFKSSIK